MSILFVHSVFENTAARWYPDYKSYLILYRLDHVTEALSINRWSDSRVRGMWASASVLGFLSWTENEPIPTPVAG